MNCNSLSINVRSRVSSALACVLPGESVPPDTYLKYPSSMPRQGHAASQSPTLKIVYKGTPGPGEEGPWGNQWEPQ